VAKFIPVEPEKWAEMVKAQAEVETLRNLGIKLESMIDPLEAENARLKAEVERLNNESDILQKCCEHQKNRIERLKAEVERLTTWQPIETLPMFQEALIVCDGLCGIYFGTRYKSGVDSSQVDVEKYKPTHWMPLPIEPAKKGGQP
jgi:hypothetical protein